jgi:hypothetical protein
MKPESIPCGIRRDKARCNRNTFGKFGSLVGAVDAVDAKVIRRRWGVRACLQIWKRGVKLGSKQTKNAKNK